MAKKRQQYRVLRALDGWVEGDVIEEGSDWPYGRAELLVKQHYLLPLAES